MGMGWKRISGGVWSTSKCKCGNGKFIVNVSSYEESEHETELKGAVFTGILKCKNNCMDVENMSQDDLQYYNTIRY
ncbi:MAG: hypothetical protein E6902_14470 [Paeniclostridium sordellii]|nr:hypothetical protein [Paeniclostridium sordellii]